MKTKSALSYFGSDSEVAGELSAMLDHCNHVTIPMVGGASIIPYLKARSIVANDLNSHAINFYRVVSGVYGSDTQNNLLTRCGLTLSHPDEIKVAQNVIKEVEKNGFRVDTIPNYDTWAWAYWAVSWIGRKGKGGTRYMGGMPSVRRTGSGGSNSTRLAAAANDLLAWKEHFKRCEWECKSFRELLPLVAEKEGCGIYCDPPWLGFGDDYMYPFTPEDHEELHSLLSRFKETTVLVRYGDHSLVRKLYQGWNVIEASSRTQANSVKGELWITNRLTNR